MVDVDDSAILADNKERLYFVQREDDQRLVRYEDGEIEVLDSAEFIYLCDVSSDGSTILYTKPFQDDFAMSSSKPWMVKRLLGSALMMMLRCS